MAILENVKATLHQNSFLRFFFFFHLEMNLHESGWNVMVCANGTFEYKSTFFSFSSLKENKNVEH